MIYYVFYSCHVVYYSYVKTILGPIDLIEGSRKASFILPNKNKKFHRKCFILSKF